MHLLTYGGRTVIHDGSVEGSECAPKTRNPCRASDAKALDASIEHRSRNAYNRSRNENDTKSSEAATP